MLVLYVLLISYYHRGFRQLKSYKHTNIKGTTKVTIVIPARNEADTIGPCLQSIIKQTYPVHLLQVLVVNDFSTDATCAVVQQQINLQQSVANGLAIGLLHLQHYIQEGSTNSYKKKGIEIAISKATGELIICTDADCTAGTNWVSNIVSYYEKTNAQFIAAPVCLIPSPTFKKESLGVRSFQTLDFATLQGITAASVYKNFHTMCNGANLAYTKQAFEAVNGFAGIDALPTGDDMLLMYKIKKQFPTQIQYLKSEAATVQSLTVPTWGQFINQRIRWASKATAYDDKNIFYALLIVYFVNVFVVALCISLFFASQNWLWVLLYIVVKSSVEYWFLLPVLLFFKQQKLRKWFFICITLHIIYTVVAGAFGKFGKYSWKGREIVP